eukprot:336266_1
MPGKTRWLSTRKLNALFLLVFPYLHAQLEQNAAANNSEGAHKARGLLNQMLNIRIVYVSHILLDLLEPICKLNIRHQSPDSLVCELPADWEELESALNALSNPLSVPGECNKAVDSLSDKYSY